MHPPSAQDQFWQWFQANGDRLRAAMYGEDDAARQDASEELREAVAVVEPGFILEFGADVDGVRELIVSADGQPERVDPVKEFVDAAPALRGWSVIAFRPRMDIGDSIAIRLEGESVSPEDVWFQLADGDEWLRLTLYVRGLNAANERLRGLGASLLAEHAMGERDAITLLNSLQFKPLPRNPESVGLRPFRELVAAIDAEKARKFPPPGKLPVTDDEWQGLQGTIEDSPALVLLNGGLRGVAGHPAYDRRLVVSVPFNRSGPDGMPASEEEYNAVQALGTRADEALQAEQQSLLALTVMTQGRRDLVFYTSDAESALRRVEALQAEVETHRIEAGIEWDTFWGMYRSFCQAAAAKEDAE